MALLFTAYGRRGTLGERGEKGGLKAGLVLVSLCGCAGLNLTPDSGRLVNSLRGQSAACGNLFLSAEQPKHDHVSV